MNKLLQLISRMKVFAGKVKPWAEGAQKVLEVVKEAGAAKRRQDDHQESSEQHDRIARKSKERTHSLESIGSYPMAHPQSAPTKVESSTIEATAEKAIKAIDDRTQGVYEALDGLSEEITKALDVLIEAAQGARDQASKPVKTEDPQVVVVEAPPQERPEQTDEEKIQSEKEKAIRDHPPGTGILRKAFAGNVKKVGGRVAMGAVVGAGAGALSGDTPSGWDATNSWLSGLFGGSDALSKVIKADSIVFEATSIVFTAAIGGGEGESESDPGSTGDNGGESSSSGSTPQPAPEVKSPQQAQDSAGHPHPRPTESSASQAGPTVPNDGSNRIKMSNGGSIRDKDLQPKLQNVFNYAAEQAGVDKVEVMSGGQVADHSASTKGKKGGWTGSHRHDLGGAGDIRLWKDGRVLDFNDPTDRPYFERFVKESSKAGATGIGAATEYMGSKTIHVGYGSEATWGAGGKGNPAPWVDPAVAAGRSERKDFDVNAWASNKRMEAEARTEMAETKPVQGPPQPGPEPVKKVSVNERDDAPGQSMAGSDRQRQPTDGRSGRIASKEGVSSDDGSTVSGSRKFATYLGIDNEESR